MNLLTNRNRLTDIAKKNTLLLPKGKGGRDKLGVWDYQIPTTILCPRSGAVATRSYRTSKVRSGG